MIWATVNIGLNFSVMKPLGYTVVGIAIAVFVMMTVAGFIRGK